MTKLDDAIHGALTQEDAEFLACLEQEPGALQQITGIFGGPLSWIYWLFLVAAAGFGIFGVYAAWQFAIALEVRPLFYWGAVTGLCLVVVAVVRLIFFMQINTNRVLREVKRLELQVAQLNSQIKQS